MIRSAREDDLPSLQGIERAAGALFRDLGMNVVADDATAAIGELRQFQRQGLAWVFADEHDRPAAYILVDVIDGKANIEQVSVHPRHARLGLGGQLIDMVDQWAAERGLSGLT